MMRMWRFLVALAVFCLFLALYLSPGLFQPRIALSSQFPAQITHIGFGLILAAAILAVAFRFKNSQLPF